MTTFQNLSRVGCVAASVLAMSIGAAAQSKMTPPKNSGLMKHTHMKTTQSQSQILAAFPQAPEGMQRLVISVPPRSDETAYRVGITAGRMQITDGVNTVRLSGQLEKQIVEGWGYSYYTLEGADRPAISTLMGVPSGQPSVEKYLSVGEKLVRYNSRMPLVVYVPEGFDVRYRTYAAGNTYSASANLGDPLTVPPKPVMSHHNGAVFLATPEPVSLPAGSVATVRLYDHMLMDTDSTYATQRSVIDRLPATLVLPENNVDDNIAGPAVSVSIHDAQGRLLYTNDTVTPLSGKRMTHLNLKAVRY